MTVGHCGLPVHRQLVDSGKFLTMSSGALGSDTDTPGCPGTLHQCLQIEAGDSSSSLIHRSCIGHSTGASIPSLGSGICYSGSGSQIYSHNSSTGSKGTAPFGSDGLHVVCSTLHQTANVVCQAFQTPGSGVVSSLHCCGGCDVSPLVGEPGKPAV